MSYKDRAIGPSLSADIVSYLRTDKTLKEIGALAGLSESFMSRVAKGKRSFRFEHLVKLEISLGKPLPALLLKARNLDTLPDGIRSSYHSLQELLESSGEQRLEFCESTESLAKNGGDKRGKEKG